MQNGNDIDEKWQENYFSSEYVSYKSVGKMKSVYFTFQQHDRKTETLGGRILQNCKC